MIPISIESLSKTYKGKKGAKVEALTALDLEIREGEVFGFLGPNGAGKSTTINILTGQIRQTSGGGKLFDVSVDDPKARRRIGYLPENPAFFHFMNALEYLSMVGQVYGMTSGTIRQASERVLALLDLEHAARRPIKGYSKGMVQRLGLAQALLHDPDLYILDEPMSGLDPVGRALVKNIILQLKQQGKTVFFSTHITADVEQVCDRMAVLVKGRLQALEAVADLMTRGVEGYQIVYRDPSGQLCEVRTEAGRLKSKLQETIDLGVQVERIEPLRQSLEDFFLATLKGAADADR